MSSKEEILKADLAVKLKSAKDEVDRRKNANVEKYKTFRMAELEEKLKPVEEISMWEIEKINQKMKEREREIDDATWLETQNFLRQQEEMRRKELRKMEEDVDNTKKYYEEEKGRLDEKNVEIERKTNEVEASLNETYLLQLSEHNNEKNRTEDLRLKLTKDKRELEMGQIRENLEFGNKCLEERKNMIEKSGKKQDELHEKSVQQTKKVMTDSLVFQQNVVNMSILDLGSDKIKAVNLSINGAKAVASNVIDTFEELLPLLSGMDRVRTTPTIRIKSGDVKLAKSRFCILSNLLKNLSSELTETEFKLASVENQKELVDIIHSILGEINLAKMEIASFLGYLNVKDYTWTDEKIMEFTTLIKKISDTVNALDLLENKKRNQMISFLKEASKV